MSEGEKLKNHNTVFQYEKDKPNKPKYSNKTGIIIL